MRFSPIPRKDAKGIDFHTYENLVRQSRRSINILFDETIFQTIEDDTGIFVTMVPVEGTAVEEKTWAFENSINSTSNTWTVDIEQGHFTVQGDTDYPINKLTYNLPDANVASNAYSVVTFDIASRVAEVKILPTYPTPTASQVLVPLVGYSSNSTTGVWTEEIIYHRGNINFATSIVFG